MGGFTKFYDSVTGKTSARRALAAQEAAAAKSQEYMREGYKKARGEFEDSYSKQMGEMSKIPGRYKENVDPYMTGGMEAFQGMRDQISDNPLENERFLDKVNRAQLSARERLGAMGMSESGGDILEETGLYNSMADTEIARQDALRGQVADYGYNATTNYAGLESDVGMGMANIEGAYGKDLANMTVAEHGGYSDSTLGLGNAKASAEMAMGKGVTGLFSSAIGLGTDFVAGKFSKKKTPSKGK